MAVPSEPAKNGGSFIVRIWWERSDTPPGGCWRGWIQHVGNEHQIYFASLRDLNAFIEEETGMQAAGAAPPGLV